MFFFSLSCGFLQPDQHAVRHHHRFLHRGKLSCHVCRSKVSFLLWSLNFLARVRGVAVRSWPNDGCQQAMTDCIVIYFPCRYEYHWADGTNIKKPIKCSAPKYIDYLMTWVQDQLDDETLFPSKIGRRSICNSCRKLSFVSWSLKCDSVGSVVTAPEFH